MAENKYDFTACSKLGLKASDQVALMPEGDNYGIVNANIEALLEAREAFKGLADELGLETEQDVVNMVKEIRAERSGSL